MVWNIGMILLVVPAFAKFGANKMLAFEDNR